MPTHVSTQLIGVNKPALRHRLPTAVRDNSAACSAHREEHGEDWTRSTVTYDPSKQSAPCRVRLKNVRNKKSYLLLEVAPAPGAVLPAHVFRYVHVSSDMGYDESLVTVLGATGLFGRSMSARW